ncbi:hypothetical protein TNCV_1066421 [Trichonephila clavipes]|uniref:Uncharacterized protein n=1 Tax=Trichonephila clavipes TaxID=2585209 RepID=A0A8X6R4F3_TRICX|nr:hypothetical protein TNCV_1066421 [Trichonephila clavipes]
MSKDFIQNLYASMPDSIASCFCARVGPTGFIVDDYTIEDAPVCDEESSMAAALVSELIVDAAANNFELLVQKPVVLQTTPILNSEFMMWLYAHSRPCWKHALLLHCL